MDSTSPLLHAKSLLETPQQAVDTCLVEMIGLETALQNLLHELVRLTWRCAKR